MNGGKREFREKDDGRIERELQVTEGKWGNHNNLFVLRRIFCFEGI